MTDYPYDPDLPFAVVAVGSGLVHARFRFREGAESYAGTAWADVIDTTPKPRIPEDAEFIYWQTESGTGYYARWDEAESEWQLHTGARYTLNDLLDRAGDAEIIVLGRKDDA